MRAALNIFLDEILSAYRQVHACLDSRVRNLPDVGSGIGSEAELYLLLHRLTELLSTGRMDTTESRGYGLLVTEERFKRLFGSESQQAIRDAIYSTEGGLRSITERFISGAIREMEQGTLYGIIDSFFVSEYGTRLERDYGKMHQDGLDYFQEHRLLLPASVLEQETDFVMGTVFVRDPLNHDEHPMPRMREVYVNHPAWLLRQRPNA